MAVLVELTDVDFDSCIAASRVPVLVEFEASWCAPCRALGPLLERLADAYRGRLLVARMDVDAHPRTARSFGIRSIPTLVLFREGVAVDGALGALPLDSLVELVEANLAPGRRPAVQ